MFLLNFNLFCAIWVEHDQQVIVFVCIISGNLIQITESRKGKTFGGLTLKSCEVRKEAVRQCFLFSGFLLLTTRSSSGRLHLTKVRPDSQKYIVNKYWTRLSKISRFVSGEWISYLSKWKAEGTNRSARQTNYDILRQPSSIIILGVDERVKWKCP